jgi:nitrogen fixation NifU-like protein
MDQDIYQEYIIELFKHPLNSGRLEGADHQAKAQNQTCGDSIELFLKTKDGIITEARFLGKGCAISQASASLFTGFLKGKRISEIDRIGKEDIMGLIKIDLTKNPSRMKCALLPLDALRKAFPDRNRL